MSVILNQFPDPVMKKHKTPPYTQQDYNAVNYMNGTISASDSGNHYASLHPINNTNYCFYNNGDSPMRIYQSPVFVHLAGTKIHFNKASASMNVQWGGMVIVRKNDSTHRPVARYTPTGYQIEFKWGCGAYPYTSRALFMTSAFSDAISQPSINLDYLINGQDNFTAFVDFTRAWIYVDGVMTKAYDETIDGYVNMNLSNITCNFNIDYVILSTGDKIYKGQTIS